MQDCAMHAEPTANDDGVVHLTLRAGVVVVGIACTETAVTGLHYLPPDTPARAPRSAIGQRAAAQLHAYAHDPAAPFDLPLAPAGTAFRRAVWAQLCAIACGRTLTYGALAQTLGAAPRAVGQACGDNPYPIVVPCHRVVSARGLGGFAHASDGYLIDAKRRLLVHEGVLVC